jgi:hypothetical protein
MKNDRDDLKADADRDREQAASPRANASKT